MTRGDDEVKRALGIDLARCEQAYAACNGDTEALEMIFGHNFLQPDESALAECGEQIRSFLQSGRLAVVIPMRETTRAMPAIESVLSVLTQHLPPGKVLVMDNGSDAEVVAMARGIPGVRLASSREVLERVLDCQRLLPVLNLPKLPERGKGLTVLAGYLCRHFLDLVEGSSEWLAQCDAEIALFEGYQYLEHLVWAILQAPEGRYFKMAKFGRTNECCMEARNLLDELADDEDAEPQVRQRARELYLRLAPHMWMLTGEFAIQRQLAFRRPFATGYLEETLISMFVEDCGAQHPGRNGNTVQVYNPNNRLDAANTDEKEGKMQHQISAFIHAAAKRMGPVDTWTLSDIAGLNGGYMAKPLKAAWIDSNRRRVGVAVYHNDRIIPSVATLIEEGFVNVDAGRRLGQELLEQERSTLG